MLAKHYVLSFLVLSAICTSSYANHYAKMNVENNTESTLLLTVPSRLIDHRIINSKQSSQVEINHNRNRHVKLDILTKAVPIPNTCQSGYVRYRYDFDTHISTANHYKLSVSTDLLQLTEGNKLILIRPISISKEYQPNWSQRGCPLPISV